MAPDESLLHLPPRLKRQDGAVRRIGVELELIGLEIGALSRIVADHFGAEVDVRSQYEHKISGDPRGAWSVELDFAFLKERGRKSRQRENFMAELDSIAEDILRVGAEHVVPLEIVSPPLPMDRLSDMQALIERLRQAGAQGTKAGLAYAFSMQFNPELPGTDADTIVRYLKAFLCLFDWLKHRAEVDWTRRLTLFIDPFPKPYVRKVVDPDYWPDQDALIEDYLALNPTRNRALDMLPLFAHLDSQRVTAAVDDARIKPRPTLHYRLPNCEIDEPGWGLYRAWDEWLQVEHLVAEPQRLDSLCRKYTTFLDRTLSGLFEDWKQEVIPCLKASSDL
ncbi:alpha-L-fucosidase [Candidatus Tenderia electrophaga]|jgi:hypothetical protein|uniref:Alpha-L-fucosidase n=1 Tax=Candidatus Tenderia electrophaga TaxID=1748243 RepID=A0A0S2TCY2_9GAMM|nr:alpha-L-fucosidase [Candidatus Tenderia electrophaga]